MSQKRAREYIGQDGNQKRTTGLPRERYTPGVRHSNHPPQQKHRSKCLHDVVIGGTQLTKMNSLRHGCSEECRGETHSSALLRFGLNIKGKARNGGDYQQAQTDWYCSDQSERGEFVSDSEKPCGKRKELIKPRTPGRRRSLGPGKPWVEHRYPRKAPGTKIGSTQMVIAVGVYPENRIRQIDLHIVPRTKVHADQHCAEDADEIPKSLHPAHRHPRTAQP